MRGAHLHVLFTVSPSRLVCRGWNFGYAAAINKKGEPPNIEAVAPHDIRYWSNIVPERGPPTSNAHLRPRHGGDD